MHIWRKDIEDAICDFVAVSDLAREPISLTEITIEYMDAPHVPPKRIPPGMMGVYGFWHDGTWLKIGKVGPNSNARYVSQHYNVGSSRSNLALSLMKDPEMSGFAGTEASAINTWMRTSTNRVNILVPATRGLALLSLLESFLHVRLHPRFEG